MLRFDIALQALRRRLGRAKGERLKGNQPEPVQSAVLLPFPLRKLPVSSKAGPLKRRPGRKA